MGSTGGPPQPLEERRLRTLSTRSRSDSPTGTRRTRRGQRSRPVEGGCASHRVHSPPGIQTRRRAIPRTPSSMWRRSSGFRIRAARDAPAKLVEAIEHLAFRVTSVTAGRSSNPGHSPSRVEVSKTACWRHRLPRSRSDRPTLGRLPTTEPPERSGPAKLHPDRHCRRGPMR